MPPARATALQMPNMVPLKTVGKYSLVWRQQKVNAALFPIVMRQIKRQEAQTGRKVLVQWNMSQHTATNPQLIKKPLFLPILLDNRAPKIVKNIDDPPNIILLVYISPGRSLTENFTPKVKISAQNQPRGITRSWDFYLQDWPLHRLQMLSFGEVTRVYSFY